MEETTTTNISVGYTTSGYIDSLEKTEYNCSSQSIEFTLFIGISVGISLCGLVGNGTVMCFLIFYMKQNPFTVYVLNLAIADFSLLLILLLDHAVDFIAETHCAFSPPVSLTLEYLFILFCFSYFSSMYLLTALSVERCLAVLFPIWYRCRRPKHLSGIVCGLLWTLAAIFAPVAFTRCHYDARCGQVLEVSVLSNFVIFCSFPLLSNLCLFIKLRCGSRTRHPGRLYIAILLSLICLFIFGLPFSVELFFIPFAPRIFFMSTVLTSLNSSINPIIYVLVGSCRQRHFHCSITLAFRRLFEEQVVSPQRSHVPGKPVLDTPV